MGGNSIQCPKCGHENDASAVECNKCGVTLALVLKKSMKNAPASPAAIQAAESRNPAVCPKCGHDVPKSAAECIKCGIIFSKYFEFQERLQKEEQERAEAEAARLEQERKEAEEREKHEALKKEIEEKEKEERKKAEALKKQLEAEEREEKKKTEALKKESDPGSPLRSIYQEQRCGHTGHKKDRKDKIPPPSEGKTERMQYFAKTK